MRFILALLAAPALFGQTMSIEEYQPKSGLAVPEHPLTRAKFPLIDVHGHPRGMMSPERIDQLVREMDAIHMRGMVNLDGRWGDRLAQTVSLVRAKYPGRFVVFANLDLSNIDSPEWTKKAVKQLEDDVKHGASGLKIYKTLGLDLKDTRGNRVRTDDPRFDPVWAACGRLRIPVLIHTGEPRQFFEPADKHNERWLELKEFPGRARPRDRYPSWETVMGEQHRVFERHKGTTFISAHLGWMGGDLAELGRLLDRNPNVNTEIGAVLAELGRQPRFARQWFLRYQDRVMFGKDSYNPGEYATYFRVLESSDEYFDYYRRRHAFWKMYGLDLPDEVLKKLYFKNALRIIPGFDASLFAPPKR